MGLWLHFVYLTTRSLWPAILLHFLNNSVAVLAPRVALIRVLDQEPQTAPAILYLGAAILLAAVAWALFRSRARLVQAHEPDQMPWHADFPGVEHPPPGRSTHVFRPAIGWAGASVVLLAFLIFGATVRLSANDEEKKEPVPAAPVQTTRLMPGLPEGVIVG